MSSLLSEQIRKHVLVKNQDDILAVEKKISQCTQFSLAENSKYIPWASTKQPWRATGLCFLSYKNKNESPVMYRSNLKAWKLDETGHSLNHYRFGLKILSVNFYNPIWFKNIISVYVYTIPHPCQCNWADGCNHQNQQRTSPSVYKHILVLRQPYNEWWNVHLDHGIVQLTSYAASSIPGHEQGH
jgi:hypothetical protein